MTRERDILRRLPALKCSVGGELDIDHGEFCVYCEGYISDKEIEVVRSRAIHHIGHHDDCVWRLAQEVLGMEA